MQMAKISKLLLSMEKEYLSSMQGKSLDDGQFPLDTSPLRYVSATPAEQLGFTLVC